jgi:hypothetical protein
MALPLPCLTAPSPINCGASNAPWPLIDELAKYQDAQAVFDQLQFGLPAGHDGPGIELPMAGLAFEDAVTPV